MGQPAEEIQIEKSLRDQWSDMVEDTTNLLPSDKLIATMLLEDELIEKAMECENVDQFFAMLPTIDRTIKPGYFSRNRLHGLKYKYLLILEVLNRIRTPSNTAQAPRARILKITQNLPTPPHQNWQQSE